MAGRGGGKAAQILAEAAGPGGDWKAALKDATDVIKREDAAREEASAALRTFAVATAAGGVATASFVQALSPSAVLQFHQAFRDLRAVVGTALLPVMSGLTEATRSVADALLPLARDLAPLLAEVVNAALPVVDALLDVFSLLVEALSPLLPIVTGLVGIFADLLRGVQIVVGALVGALGGALSGMGGSIKDMMQGLREVIQKFIGYMIQALAAIAQFFGLTGLVQRMAAGARQAAGQGGGVAAMIGRAARGASGGLAAAENAHFAGFESFAKEMATAAATATVGGQTKRTQEEWLAKLAGDLEDIAQNNRTLYQIIVDAIKEAWAAIQSGLAAPINAATDAGKRMAAQGLAPLRRAARRAPGVSDDELRAAGIDPDDF